MNILVIFDGFLVIQISKKSDSDDYDSRGKKLPNTQKSLIMNFQAIFDDFGGFGYLKKSDGQKILMAT